MAQTNASRRLVIGAALLLPATLGYLHEIQFGRLAKATGLYDNYGKSPDPRRNDVNSSIFDADFMRPTY